MAQRTGNDRRAEVVALWLQGQREAGGVPRTGNDRRAEVVDLWLSAPRECGGVPRTGTIWTFDGSDILSPRPVAIYKMRGEDATTDALYDCWLSEGAPDLTASKYKGPLAKPLRDIIVIDNWTA